MEVRYATRSDLLAIARVAHFSLSRSCEGLLRPSTISATLEREFSPSSLTRRMRKRRLIVAVAPTGDLAGFGSVGVEKGRVSLEMHTAGERNGRCSEWIDHVIALVRSRFPGLPVFSDVLLGNLIGEQSCEVAGFVPGEVIQRSIFGEPVVERRWWCPLPE